MSRSGSELFNWISKELDTLQHEGLYRSLKVLPDSGGRFVAESGESILNFATNDYLDLGHHPHVVGGAIEATQRFGCSASASRLVSGTLAIHEELERELAEFLGFESALVFGSGALTNLGVLSSVMGRDDLIIADRLVHATLIDGALLSRARVCRFRHNDMSDLESILAREAAAPARRVLIVTESVFSMDGDLAPLSEIVALAKRFGALTLIDEAHALGVFGPGGRGAVYQAGLSQEVDILTGTFSKSFGSYGGFVCCSSKFREFLINRARTLIYSTGLPPASAGAALGALAVLRKEPQFGERLLASAQKLRESLVANGFDVRGSATQIIPIMVKSNHDVQQIGEKLGEKGILVGAIRPPTVPSARLRLSISLAHTDRDLDQLIAALNDVVGVEG